MVRVTCDSPKQSPAGPMLVAGTALLAATLAGCHVNQGPSEVTSIVFDGQTQTLNGEVTCTTQPDGKLVILATDDGEKRNTVRVLLSRKRELVVEKVGLHVPDATGFIDDSAQVWATKIDTSYSINGRMPPNPGETIWHQFRIDVTCRYEAPIPYSPPHSPYVP